MLIQFRFKNYKSFRNDTFLDFSAAKITEYSDSVVAQGRENLLPVAAVFGANASGKSNLIEALEFMTHYVLNSFSYGGNSENQKIDYEVMVPAPFLFDHESRNEATLFEVYFIRPDDSTEKTYNYGFALDKSGVVEEWLNVKSKTAKESRTIFYRGEDDLELPGLPGKSSELIRLSLNKETLIVSLGAKLKISKLQDVWNWFNNLDVINFGNPLENAWLSRIVPQKFTDESVQRNVIDYFSTFDPSIIGFDVKTVEDEETKRKKLEINSIHHMIGGGDASIALSDESAGTLKMFALYPYIANVLNTGGLLAVDELNSRLHPLLVRNILRVFTDPGINRNHAQLLFSSHDPWQLSNNLLRRDEIWFVEKDDDGISTLYSLVDFVDESGEKIRKDESYEKNYLLGKYGAIPKLKDLDIFNSML